MRSASPSTYSSAPSRFWRKLAGLPLAVPYWLHSWSWRTVTLSARMVSVPCVITTLPSNTLIFCASSTRMRSDSRLIGLVRSAFSACAGPANPRQQVQKTRIHSGHFRITEVATDSGQHMGRRPEGLDPPSSVPLDGRGESPPPLRVVPTFGLPHLFGWSRPSVSHLGGYPLKL